MEKRLKWFFKLMKFKWEICQWSPWTVMFSWLEHSTGNQKLVGSIPTHDKFIVNFWQFSKYSLECFKFHFNRLTQCFPNCVPPDILRCTAKIWKFPQILCKCCKNPSILVCREKIIPYVVCCGIFSINLACREPKKFNI
jgi:hypothetical protein